MDQSLEEKPFRERKQASVINVEVSFDNLPTEDQSSFNKTMVVAPKTKIMGFRKTNMHL